MWDFGTYRTLQSYRSNWFIFMQNYDISQSVSATRYFLTTSIIYRTHVHVYGVYCSVWRLLEHPFLGVPRYCNGQGWSARRACRIPTKVCIGLTFDWSLYLHPYFVYASSEVWCITSDKITDFHYLFFCSFDLQTYGSV